MIVIPMIDVIVFSSRVEVSGIGLCFVVLVIRIFWRRLVLCDLPWWSPCDIIIGLIRSSFRVGSIFVSVFCMCLVSIGFSLLNWGSSFVIFICFLIVTEFCLQTTPISHATAYSY